MPPPPALRPPSRLTRTLTGHESAVNGVVFSPDGRLLATASFDGAYTAHDGAQHRVPLAEAAVVRFADTQPTRGIRTRKGQRHLPGR